MNKFTITVTEKHLDRAIIAAKAGGGSSTCCPLAQAMRDSIPGFENIGYDSALIGYTTFFCPKATTITRLVEGTGFTWERKVPEIRKMLPLKLTFTTKRPI